MEEEKEVTKPTEIIVRYDQLISTPIRDKEGNEIRRTEHHHFTFGKVGEAISGGFYIKKDTPIPDEMLLKLVKDTVV